MSELTAINGGKSYAVRPLKNGDTFKVGAMLAKVMGDKRIYIAAQEKDNMVTAMAALGAIMDQVPRELELFCADLIGIKRDFKEYKERDRQEVIGRINAMTDAEKKAGVVHRYANEYEIRRTMEDEILEEMDSYPPGTTQDVVADVMEREDFEPFLISSMRLGTVGKAIFSRYRTNTKSDTESETQTS